MSLRLFRVPACFLAKVSLPSFANLKRPAFEFTAQRLSVTVSGLEDTVQGAVFSP